MREVLAPSILREEPGDEFALPLVGDGADVVAVVRDS
jgi:hypothetical protein